jgi:LEA14-like dessication related protein
MRGTFVLIALVIIAAAQAACSSTARSIVPPRIQVVGLAALPATSDKQKFRVSLLIDNQGTEPLPIRELRFTLRLANEGILDGVSEVPLNVEALDRETLTLELDSDIVSSLSRLLAFVQGPANALPYEIYGDLTLDRRLPNVLPFSASGEVPLSTTGDR